MRLLNIFLGLMISAGLFAQIDFNVIHTSCGKANGRVSIHINNATYPIEVLWSSPNWDYNRTGESLSNLDPGEYNCAVIDANGCSGSATVEIYASLGIKAAIQGAVDSLEFCRGADPPIITLNAFVQGGNGDVGITWQEKKISSSGTYCVQVWDETGCQDRGCVSLAIIPIDCSRDPNDITGPSGYSEPRFVSINDNLNYTIRFENDSAIATAPAQRVEINYPFDPSSNPFSLRLGDFGFFNQVFQVDPSSTYFSDRIDMVDSLGVFVDVIAGIDIIENKAIWIFESIDPDTGLPPLNAQLGFLPINDSTGIGEGFVKFSIAPNEDAQTGDTLMAHADIIFDVDLPLGTNVWTNLIDAHPPLSNVDTAYSIINDSIFIAFNSVDDPFGSGVQFTSLYFSKNGAAYSFFDSTSIDSIFSFQGTHNNVYSFYTLSTDNVNNVKQKVDTSEYFISLADCNVVTNTEDAGYGSLRNALDCVGNGDTVLFNPIVFRDTIKITSDILSIGKSINILLDKVNNVSVDGTNVSSTIEVLMGHQVVIQGIKIISGQSTIGGSIKNNGTLTLVDITLVESKEIAGNVLENQGLLTLVGSCIVR